MTPSVPNYPLVTGSGLETRSLVFWFSSVASLLNWKWVKSGHPLRADPPINVVEYPLLLYATEPSDIVLSDETCVVVGQPPTQLVVPSVVTSLSPKLTMR